MKLDPKIIAHLPATVVFHVDVTAEELMEAHRRSNEGVPEMASTVDLSRAWGFSPRKWREWAEAELIPGAVKDEGGHWRLPRDAAREQFERALGRDIPRARSTSHLPRAHGPRKKREARS